MSPWYLNSSPTAGILNINLLDEAPSPVVVSGTGWRCASSGATVPNGERSQPNFGVQAGVASFGAAVDAGIPANVDSWRTPTKLTGAYAAGNWSLNARLRSNGGTNAPSVRGRWRVFRGSDISGAGAVELTSGTVLGSDTGTVATGGNGDSAATWAAPYIELFDEYLMFTFALEVRGNLGVTSGSNTRDYFFVLGGASILTPNGDKLPIERVGAVLL